MLFVTHYRWVGTRSKERSGELMALFGERGTATGTVAHYVYADGSGGFLIGDEASLAEGYANALAYSAYLEFETRPVITIDDAVPQIGAWLASGVAASGSSVLVRTGVGMSENSENSVSTKSSAEATPNTATRP